MTLAGNGFSVFLLKDSKSSPANERIQFAAPETVVDRSFGFGQYQPLFVLTKDESQFRTSQNKSLYFGTQRFTREKRKTEFRMFF